MENCVKITGIKKSYGNTKVLKGIDLTIKKGEVFCLLGSNGAGKTTLVKILATLLNFEEGEAKICGNCVKTNARAVRKVISLTGQFAAIDGLLTGRENLILVAKLLRIKNAQQKVAELLQRFDLLDKADEKASTYSGGMKRRLDLAMTLIGNPELIFLDEPTTGLDPQNRIEVWSTIKELAKMGVTVFLTTQYLEEAEQLADRVAILHEGKIIRQGTVHELKGLIEESSIEVSFDSMQAFLTAKNRLEDYEIETKKETLSICIRTKGSIGEFANILSHLDNIGVAHIEQKKATLEEVFLKLVAKKDTIGEAN